MPDLPGPALSAWRGLCPLASAALASLCLACGPSDTDSAGTTDSSSESEAGTEADMQLEGISVVRTWHSYQCIDGCEGYYSDEWFNLELLADPDGPALDVSVAWHDWTRSESTELSSSSSPWEQIEHLEPGEVKLVTFHTSQSGFCDNLVDWNEPFRALISIEGVEVEVAGNSVGSGGWDC